MKRIRIDSIRTKKISKSTPAAKAPRAKLAKNAHLSGEKLGRLYATTVELFALPEETPNAVI